MMSNFEEGFDLYIKGIDLPEYLNGRRNGNKTKTVNKAIRLMASEDYKLMKQIVVNKWAIERALSK